MSLLYKIRQRKPIRKSNQAFTLLELIVVIVLMGILLTFSMPQISSVMNKNKSKAFATWLNEKISELKRRAKDEKRLYIMNIDTLDNSIWIANSTQIYDNVLEASKSKFKLPESLTITGVSYPKHIEKIEKLDGIYFYEGGYCDRAAIFLRNNITQEEKTILIEPFLPQVKILEGTVDFQ